MTQAASYLMTTCQVGAEGALKSELARRWPAFRFAYSRPGFVTFRLPSEHRLRENFDLGSVFARYHGFSRGKVLADSLAARCQAVRELLDGQSFDRLHVFHRDRAAPADFDFEPGPTPADAELAQTLLAALPGIVPADATVVPAREGERVLSVVVVGENEWWLGVHRVRGAATAWPGGLREIEQPLEIVSRAYLKLVEGLAWSRLPLQPGDVCLELGCAPGGAAQALLERGMRVIGVDPASMDPEVVDHPQFTHLRQRGHELKKSLLTDVRWVLADMNVPPSYTLDTVENIVTNRNVQVSGVLLTLKLLDWKLADEIPDYVARVQSWGFPWVECRQLMTNRREFCLAAARFSPPHVDQNRGSGLTSTPE